MTGRISAVIIISILFTREMQGKPGEKPGWEGELRELARITAEAKIRVRDADIRWNRWLKVLPDVSVSKRAPYADIAETGETYLSVTFNTGTLYDLTEIGRQHEMEQRQALRRIESLSHTIKVLIEKKYLLADQIEKTLVISRSVEDPIESANRQDRAAQLEVQLQETEIEIEKNYAEMEYECVRVER